MILRPLRSPLSFLLRSERPGADVVEALQCTLIQLDLKRPQRADELIHGARADDRRGDRGIMKHPRQRDISRFFAHFPAEAFPFLKLWPKLRDTFLNAFAGATSFLLLLQHAAEQATFERAPWDHADAILDAGRQHFQLDRAREQAVLALLADEAQEISPPRLGLRRDNVPS